MLQLFHAVLWAHGVHEIADTYNTTEKDCSKPHQVLWNNGKKYHPSCRCHCLVILLKG